MITFDSPYDQYTHRNGQEITIVGYIFETDAKHDTEVLPMLRVKFSDGEIIEAWPEEVKPLPQEVKDFILAQPLDPDLIRADNIRH